MVKLLPTFLVLSLAASSTGAASAEVVNYPQYALSVRGDVEILLWVAESLLEAAERPADLPANWWPIVDNARSALQRNLRSAPECAQRLHEEAQREQSQGVASASSTPLDYESFLASAPVVVVGQVQRVQPGVVLVGEMRVRQRVVVTLSEVLRDAERTLFPGDELTYLGSGGFLRLGGGFHCSLEEPQRAVPREGDRVVLTAWSPAPGDRFVNPSTVFALHGDTVTVPSGTRFKKGRIALEDLRIAAAVVEDGGGP